MTKSQGLSHTPLCLADSIRIRGVACLTAGDPFPTFSPEPRMSFFQETLSIWLQGSSQGHLKGGPVVSAKLIASIFSTVISAVPFYDSFVRPAARVGEICFYSLRARQLVIRWPGPRFNHGRGHLWGSYSSRVGTPFLLHSFPFSS